MSNIKVISQYIKDLSFEVPRGFEVFLEPISKPDIELSVDIDATKINEKTYEIALKIKADAKSDAPIFICEVKYCGICVFENVKEDMIEQLLLVYCPNLLFPFARKIIADATLNSGLPPLMIDPIDFHELYLKRK